MGLRGSLKAGQMTFKEGGLFAGLAGDYGADLYSTGYGKPLQNSKDWLYYVHQGLPDNSTGCIYYGPNGIYRGIGGAGIDLCQDHKS